MERHVEGISVSRRELVRAGAAATIGSAAIATGSGTAAAAYDGWLDDVDNYDGTHDYRGEDSVRVSVGAGENGLRFDPAAVLIDEGATVEWVWTGEGGDHNVAHVDGGFESELTGAEGHTFERAFDDADTGDTFRYVCTPHEAVDMKGVIAVGDIDDDLIPVDAGGNGGETREFAVNDIAVLSLAFGFAGALLIPLFYAAHRKANLGS